MRPTSSIRIREAIDTVRAATVAAPLADTIDTVKSGDPDHSLTGIITHEPSFYTHIDETDWLQGWYSACSRTTRCYDFCPRSPCCLPLESG